MLGDKLRTLRTAKNITMKELGQIVGVGESTISMYETNKNNPELSTLIKLAAYFRVTIDFLMGLDISEKKELIVLNMSEIIKEIKKGNGDIGATFIELMEKANAEIQFKLLLNFIQHIEFDNDGKIIKIAYYDKSVYSHF